MLRQRRTQVHDEAVNESTSTGENYPAVKQADTHNSG